MADYVMSCYQNGIISFLIFVIVIAFSEGVKINSLGLTTGLPCARNGTSAHFTFNVTLASNEVIESVMWSKDEETGSYEWTKAGAKGLGPFSAANDTSVNAGEFIFNSVKFSQTGNYSVIISTNIGTDFATFSFVVYDYSGFSLKSNSPGLGLNPKTKCIWRITANVDSMTPYPNISCIFERDLNESPQLPVSAIASMAETITDLGDGSFSYNMTANVTMEKIPVESFIDCSNWIQNSKIQMIHIRDSAVSGQPCPEPPSMKNYTYEMVSGRDSCYGGYIPYTQFNYSCIEDHGIIPVHKKMLRCEEGEWIEKDDIPWPVCKQSSNHQLRFTTMSSANTAHIEGLVLSAILYILCYSNST